MTNKEAMTTLGISHNAYYRWKDKLGIKTPMGIITDEDFLRIRTELNTNPKVLQQKHKPDYYRIIIKDPIGASYVVAAGLTLSYARVTLQKYIREGLCCCMINCRTNKRYYA